MRATDFPGFGRARVISGHEISRSLEQLYPRREIRRIVLLRDPLHQQISPYNWRMMDYLAKGLATYSFELHLRAQPRDYIAHFLLSRWPEIPRLRLKGEVLVAGDKNLETGLFGLNQQLPIRDGGPTRRPSARHSRPECGAGLAGCFHRAQSSSLRGGSDFGETEDRFHPLRGNSNISVAISSAVNPSLALSTTA
jgi:hypothetical protein